MTGGADHGSDRPGRGVLWSAMLGGAPLDARIDAAITNGFRGITVGLDDVEAMAATGGSAPDAVARARDGGLEHVLLEALASWYEHVPAPAWFTSAAFDTDDHLRAVEALDLAHVTVVAALPATEPTEALVERFATVCDRFADLGVSVHLEFTPVPPIGSLAVAWDIVRGADRPNGGILFDTWHFFRGDPDLDLLGTIPGQRIFSVQISDGAPELRESLIKDTWRHRLLPGEGTFDLERVLSTLDAISGLRLVGPEVLSVELNELAPVEAMRRAAASTDRVLARALSHPRNAPRGSI